MLAFPLFVVVVGVDPRWVLKALEAHYWELLAGEEGEEPSARSIDYVEKIFQVPFQLRPMSEGVTRNMLAGLLPVTLARPMTGVASGDEPAETPRPAIPTVTPTSGSISAPSRRAARRDLTPGSLMVDAKELQAMQALSPLLGSTPRTIKRFVNIYRLMKVRAQDRPAFLRDQGGAGEFRLVMFLLAVSAGRPGDARALFADLRRPDNGATPLGGLASAAHLLEELGSTAPWASVPVREYAPFVDDVRRFSFVLEGLSELKSSVERR